MLRYMADTNICIFVLKGSIPTLQGRFNRHAQQLCISTITVAELRSGAERSRRVPENHHEIEQLQARIEVLDFDSDAASHYGQIRHQVRRQPVGHLDALIAGHARSRGLTLVTDNVSEFSRVPGLQIENWIRRP